MTAGSLNDLFKNIQILRDTAQGRADRVCIELAMEEIAGLSEAVVTVFPVEAAVSALLSAVVAWEST